MFKVADHFSVELSKRASKYDLLATLKDHLVKRENLPVVTSMRAPVELPSFSDEASHRVSMLGKVSNVAPVLTGHKLGCLLSNKKMLL